MKHLLCLLLLCANFGCQNSPSNLEQWMQASGKVKVLATTAIIDDLVGQVGGDKIDHIALIPGAMDPHSYELVKGDDEKLTCAEIVFYNGLGLEHGASLHYRLEKHPKAIALGEALRQHDPSAILFDRGQIDPHIWLDASLWKEAVDPIVKAFSEIDPANRDYYVEQGKRVKASLESLDSSLKERFKAVPSEKKYLVTSHDAFNYFTRRYLAGEDPSWKIRFCAPEGLAPDGQLSCNDLQMVVDYLDRHCVEVIFPEANISRDSLKKILSVCSEKKLKLRIAKAPLYSDTLGDEGSSCTTYHQMMEHNANTMIAGWTE